MTPSQAHNVSRGRLGLQLVEFLVFLLSVLHVLSFIVISSRYEFIEEEYSKRPSFLIMYKTSFYYLIGTITTAGYGDLTPKRPTSMLITMLIEFLGLIFYGFSFQKVIEYVSQA